MKKLMFAIAAVAAGTVLADVTSANIVGYQKTGVIKQGAYRLEVATFDTVNGATAKLGDFTPVAVSTAITRNNFSIQMFDKNGYNGSIADDEQVKALIPEDELEDFLDNFGEEAVIFSFIDGHWYLQCDENDDGDPVYPMDNYPVPYGTGFELSTMASFETGVTMQYSGQVAQDAIDTIVCAKGHYDLTGNVSPVDTTLGEITAVPVGGGKLTRNNFSIQIYNSKGYNGSIRDDEQVKALIPADELEDFLDNFGDEAVIFSYINGTWYLQCDENDDGDPVYPMTNYPLKAGAGFMMNTMASFETGAYLVLPSAL